MQFNAKEQAKILFYVSILKILMSFSIAWWVELRTWILTWLEIDIESSHDVDIEYSSQVMMLISTIQVESECRYENLIQWSVYKCCIFSNSDRLIEEESHRSFYYVHWKHW
jgi:hypothetical protein